MLTKIIGDFGENKVAKLYKDNGYKIISRNFSCRFGELDIVAQKNDVIAIVEVKTRKNDKFANAKEFVDYKKQQRIKSTSMVFLQKHKLDDMFIRFDVAEVYTDIGKINIIKNAF